MWNNNELVMHTVKKKRFNSCDQIPNTKYQVYLIIFISMEYEKKKTRLYFWPSDLLAST